MTRRNLDEAFEKLDRGIELRQSGNLRAAQELFLQAGEAGLAQGYLELADRAHYEGQRKEAHKWVQRMEDLAKEDADGAAHFSCYLAYEFRWANCPAQEKEEKAKYHLQQAAELGGSTAQALLAGRYRSGTGGFPKDSSLYEHWMSKAIEHGDIDALCSHVELLVKDGHSMSSELLNKLVTAAQLSQRAADLLNRANGS